MSKGPASKKLSVVKTCTVCGTTSEHNPSLKWVAGKDDKLLCSGCVEVAMGAWDVSTVDQLAKLNNFSNEASTKVSTTPKSIITYLDQYVIGQDEAKKALALGVVNHLKRIRHDGKNVVLSKTNILMCGPTGTGKTLLVETIANYLDIPFARADATSLTQAGYVGDDVESVLSALLFAAGGDVKKAEQGIIFIDEIDKIAAKPSSSGTKDPGGEGVQQSFLTLMQGTRCSVPVGSTRKGPNTTQEMMDTTNILFIFGGAFVGLDDIIKHRHAHINTKTTTSGIGFLADVTSKKPDHHLCEDDILPEDLIKYGFIPEFIGRIPVITHLTALSVEVLEHIIIKPKNAQLKQYAELFQMDGVALNMTPEAIRAIAEEAFKEKTGARGITRILHRIFSPAMLENPELPELEAPARHSCTYSYVDGAYIRDMTTNDGEQSVDA